MITLENWALIRHLHLSEGESMRSIAEKLEISRNTVAKAVASSSPARDGESSIMAIRGFIERHPLVVAELDLEIAVVAARLRARHGLKLTLPDALVIAIAIHHGAGALVTTDRSWPTKSKLGFEGNLIKLSPSPVRLSHFWEAKS